MALYSVTDEDLARALCLREVSEEFLERHWSRGVVREIWLDMARRLLDEAKAEKLTSD